MTNSISPMVHCPKFDLAIIELADTYGVLLFGDFEQAMEQEKTHIRLRQKGFDDLVLERIWKNQLIVSHVSVQNGDLMRDPEIEFFYHSERLEEKKFQPINFRNDYVGYDNRFATLNNGRLITFNTVKTKDAIDFLPDWAENIRSQGWLDKSQVEII